MTDWSPPPIEPRWLAADRRPDGVSDATVDALGKLGEAVEWMERARGALYEFHQKSGRVDLLLGEAADELEQAGHREIAEGLRTHVIGRNVIEGRWSFQIVEEYDDSYWSVIRDFHRAVEEELVAGAQHVFESEMKDRRRTDADPFHARRPPSELT